MVVSFIEIFRDADFLQKGNIELAKEHFVIKSFPTSEIYLVRATIEIIDKILLSDKTVKIYSAKNLVTRVLEEYNPKMTQIAKTSYYDSLKEYNIDLQTEKDKLETSFLDKIDTTDAIPIDKKRCLNCGVFNEWMSETCSNCKHTIFEKWKRPFCIFDWIKKEKLTEIYEATK